MIELLFLAIFSAILYVIWLMICTIFSSDERTLIKCKDCNKPVSGRAKICVHCGVRLRNHGFVNFILYIIFIPVIVITIFIIIGALIQDKEPSVMSATDELNSAKYVCGEFVRRSLHDPDSADLEPSRSYPVETLKKGVYRVIVSLRAKNGFGAMRKSFFDCKTTLSSGNWVVLSIKEIR
ncbi:MAG: hypothetical protein R3D71_05815 [Rickettsiales bacterium]